MLSNKNKGITLVALVITIIILLILAGISISVLTNQGLFGKAKDAKERTENAQKQEQDILGQYETELNQYDKNTIAYKVNNGEIKVGDYVSYTPDTVTNLDEKYTTLISNFGTYSGSDVNTESTLTQETNLKWRVLDVKDGRVRLISATSTKSKIELKGFNGYNNGVKLLDDTCDTLYNNLKLAYKVQNLKIDNITEYMVNQPKKDTTIYNPPNINYPIIVEQEENQNVENANSIIPKLKVSDQSDFVIGKSVSKINSLKKTYWLQSMNLNDSFINSKYYELFTSNFPTYWIASRCIFTRATNADFNIQVQNSHNIGSYILYGSDGSEYVQSYSFRPVVTLNSNVQIDTENSGDGSTAEQAYVIK